MTPKHPNYDNKKLEEELERSKARYSDSEVERLIKLLLDRPRPQRAIQGIQVGVINPEQSVRANIEVEPGVVTSSLTKHMIDHFKLPTKLSDNYKLNYSLRMENQHGVWDQLDESLIIDGNGVRSGTDLHLFARPQPITAESLDAIAGVLTSPELTSNEIFISGNTPLDHTTSLYRRLLPLTSKQRDNDTILSEWTSKPSGLLGVSAKKRSVEELIHRHHLRLTKSHDLIVKSKPSTPELDEEESDLEPLFYYNFDLKFYLVEEDKNIYNCNSQWREREQIFKESSQFRMSITLEQLEVDFLRNMRIVTRAGNSAYQSAEQLGTELFQTVFDRRIYDNFKACQNRAKAEGCVVRIRLDFSDTPELINYPWELFYSPDDDGFLALQERMSIVRYHQNRISPSEFRLPLRMLVVTASAPGFTPINIEQEKKNIRTSLRHLIQTNELIIDWLDDATPKTLLNKIRNNFQIHIFHYIGHGDTIDSEGYLALHADRGDKIARLSIRHLSTILDDCLQLKLVTLNTCKGARSSARDPFANIAMGLMKNTSIPAVVAMQHEIQDSTAFSFSGTFYKALLEGVPIDTAMTNTRRELNRNNRLEVEWFIPAFYSCSSDGIILQQPDQSELTVAQD